MSSENEHTTANIEQNKPGQMKMKTWLTFTNKNDGFY